MLRNAYLIAFHNCIDDIVIASQNKNSDGNNVFENAMRKCDKRYELEKKPTALYLDYSFLSSIPSLPLLSQWSSLKKDKKVQFLGAQRRMVEKKKTLSAYLIQTLDCT